MNWFGGTARGSLGVSLYSWESIGLKPCPGEVVAVPGGASHIHKYFLAKHTPV